MRIFFLLPLLFVLLVWMPVESAWHDFCFNNYDLGIYGQAIELLSWDNPNPWLSTRDVFLFNDHFDPILFFLLPLKGVLPAGLLAIRVEMISLLLAASSPLWLCRKGLVSNGMAAVCVGLILFSPMTLDAAFYPAHPGTWSLAPLSWMFAFILAEKFGWSLFMLMLTLACKEEYPFVGMVIGLILFIKQKKRAGILFVSLSFAWALLVFVVRPRVLGPSSMYTDAVSGFEGVLKLLSGESTTIFLQRLSQLVLPLFIMFFGTRKSAWRWLTIPLAAMFILLAVRLAGGYWGNHRSAPLVVTLAYGLVFVLGNVPLSKRRGVVMTLAIIALAFPSLELGSRMWRGKSFKKHCPHDPARLDELHAASKILRERSDGTVIAQGNLIPPAVDLKGIAHLGSTREQKFRYLWIEKNRVRNSWPISPEDMEKIEQDWRANPKVTPLLDGEAVLLLEAFY